jgi:hypothetical protein
MALLTLLLGLSLDAPGLPEPKLQKPSSSNGD